MSDAGYKPVLVGPQPFSFENLLRYIDRAPAEETDRFVEAIYADRKQAAGRLAIQYHSFFVVRSRGEFVLTCFPLVMHKKFGHGSTRMDTDKNWIPKYG